MSESAPGQGDAGTTTDSDGDNSSVECPTCGKDDFETVGGMHSHHGYVHGESIAKVEHTCERCGTTRELYKSELPETDRCESCARLIGHEVSEETRRKLSEAQQHKERNLVEVNCAWCGDPTDKRPDMVERHEYLHCSQECQWAHHSERYSGENSVFWKGGQDDHYYGPEWYRIAREVRERDNHECQRCGVHQDELDIQLHVHHIVPFRKYDNREKANDKDNLVSLCCPCHNTVEDWGLKPDNR